MLPNCLPSFSEATDKELLRGLCTIEEIQAQLKHLPNQSSQGPDGVPYSVWKNTPGSNKLLLSIYGAVPKSWGKK